MKIDTDNADAKYIDVYVDDVKINGVFAVDANGGWVDVYKQDKYNNLVCTDFVEYIDGSFRRSIACERLMLDGTNIKLVDKRTGEQYKPSPQPKPVDWWGVAKTWCLIIALGLTSVLWWRVENRAYIFEKNLQFLQLRAGTRSECADLAKDSRTWTKNELPGWDPYK